MTIASWQDTGLIYKELIAFFYTSSEQLEFEIKNQDHLFGKPYAHAKPCTPMLIAALFIFVVLKIILRCNSNKACAISI